MAEKKQNKGRWMTWRGFLVVAMTLSVSTSLMVILPENEHMHRITGCILLAGFSSISLPGAVKEVRPRLYKGLIKRYGDWLEGGKKEQRDIEL
ncbi:hypothetical protein CR205_12885 [Alteribacter lacisalsi]|uniref:Uncharacterized protein n=1 Tax=Alteribacter lacisalsi TaxID=2045244 RepID=A0A2W0HIG8_9BACI|nr:hypothetical protein [Alteribacter lacisalsi]PYZ96599.1 hypothetical protein CR205_12885 [Alteribacter lacisalsi]